MSPQPPKTGSTAFLFPIIILTILFSIMAICSGRYGISVDTVIKIILARIFCIEPTWSPTMDTLVMGIRIPRVLAAIMVGGALSLSGATYQGVFKNPLVSPDILGVSMGACVGAALAIIFHWGSAGVQILALIIGLFSVMLTTSIPRFLKNDSTLMLVLSGVIVSGFMSAAMGLLKHIADPETELAAITYWQLGSLAGTKITDVISVAPAMLITMTVLIGLRWRINLLSLGDNEARSIGVNIKAVRGLAILCATVLTGCAVCISGSVGWIGLIIPHLARMLIGPDNTKVMPFSVFMGTSFLLVTDTLARTLTVTEIPLSVITGFVGAPLFAWMLAKQRIRLR